MAVKRNSSWAAFRAFCAMVGAASLICVNLALRRLSSMCCCPWLSSRLNSYFHHAGSVEIAGRLLLSGRRPYTAGVLLIIAGLAHCYMAFFGRVVTYGENMARRRKRNISVVLRQLNPMLTNFVASMAEMVIGGSWPDPKLVRRGNAFASFCAIVINIK